MRRIPYAMPSITEREIRYVEDAITNGWGEHCYDYLVRLRKEFAEHLGVKHAFPTSSCTGALHMGLSALGVGPGDEVIVPDATWIATISPVTYLNATPVFVDVRPDTWCLDPECLEQAITPRTRAIVVVHLYGSMTEMNAVTAIAGRHGIPVVEDAAEALGSEYDGKRAGSMGDFATFSFHGTKTMTTGEGGMLVTNRDDLAETITILDNHGRDPKVPRMFWCEKVGFKYRMSNLQAALGCAQMERLDEMVDKRRQIYAWYRELTADLPDLAWNVEPEGTRNSYWMSTLILGDSQLRARDDVIARLEAAGVDARPFFYPVSSFPMFDAAVENPVSRRLGARGINLPSYFDMTREDAEYVAGALGEACARC